MAENSQTILPQPARVSGLDTDGQISALATYQQNLYAATRKALEVLQAIGELGADTITPADADVNRQRINAIVEICGGITL